MSNYQYNNSSDWPAALAVIILVAAVLFFEWFMKSGFWLIPLAFCGLAYVVTNKFVDDESIKYAVAAVMIIYTVVCFAIGGAKTAQQIKAGKTVGNIALFIHPYEICGRDKDHVCRRSLIPFFGSKKLMALEELDYYVQDQKTESWLGKGSFWLPSKACDVVKGAKSWQCDRQPSPLIW